MKAVKFNFGQDFEEAGETAAELEARAQEQRIAEAREAGHSEGFGAGQSAAKEMIETEIAATLAVVGERLETLLGSHVESQAKLERQAVQLSLSLANKISAAAIARYPHAELEALVAECLEICREEKRLVIRVADSLSDETARRCEDLKTRSSFLGDLIIIGDPAITPGDCIVEWADGGAERQSDHTVGEIERLVQEFIMGPALEAPSAPGADAPKSEPEDTQTLNPQPLSEIAETNVTENNDQSGQKEGLIPAQPEAPLASHEDQEKD